MDNVKEIHNNYDAVFKEALMLYKNKTLDFLGLDLAMIEKPINTEVTEIKVTQPPPPKGGGFMGRLKPPKEPSVSHFHVYGCIYVKNLGVRA